VGVGWFQGTRTALNAAKQVEASALDDLQNSMWQAPAPAYTIGTQQVPGLLSGAFGIDTAMQVPAFARGVSVITGVGSGLPLLDIDPATGGPLQPYGLTARPAMWPGNPNATLWRMTLTELVAHGRAHWRVLARNALGHPVAVEPIPRDRLTVHEVGEMLIDGQRVWTDTRGVDHPNEVLVFDTGAPGALDHGWLALQTALSMETAANNYASSPLPALALRSLGVDLTAEESQELLAAWETARRTRSTAYVNSQVGIETYGWSAAELQLVEGRQQAAIEIARVLNVDPYFVGASIPGSSLTYQNRTDLYQSLLDFTIMPLLRVIEQRLSMPDVSGESRQLRFDTGAFLRANLPERVAALTAYVTAGVITPEQAADLEPMLRRGDVPQ
jgi:HK97 family phage portal protein